MDSKVVEMVRMMAGLTSVVQQCKALINAGKTDIAVAAFGQATVDETIKSAERKTSPEGLAMGRITAVGWRAMEAQFLTEVKNGVLKPGTHDATDVSSLLGYIQSRRNPMDAKKHPGKKIGMLGASVPGLSVNGKPVNITIRLDGIARAEDAQDVPVAATVAVAAPVAAKPAPGKKAASK